MDTVTWGAMLAAYSGMAGVLVLLVCTALLLTGKKSFHQLRRGWLAAIGLTIPFVAFLIFQMA